MPQIIKRDRGVLIIIIAIAIGCIVSLISSKIPGLREFLMPRFGWIGLFLYCNTLIFLVPWVFKPNNTNLLISSIMTFVITFLNAKTLYEKGTVATVENPFIDRLHSSWLWLILPFTCAGIYLLFVYFRNTRNQTTENTNIS